MDTLPSPSAKLTTTDEHREEELISSLSVKVTTTVGEHRREEELRRKGRLILFVLLTFNSWLAIYLLWGDLVSVASAMATYVALGLLLGRRFGSWEPRTDDGAGTRWWLGFVVCFLFLSLCLHLQLSSVFLEVSNRSSASSMLSLAVLEVSRLARTAASSTSAPMLVAAAGAAGLVIGGGCAYLLHRRTWSKDEHRHELIFLPLRQDPRS